VNEDTLSEGQLSPPFQFPHPLGAVAGLSLGIDVGIIGGGMLGETAPVPTTVTVDEDEVVGVVKVDELVEVLEVLMVEDEVELIW